MGFFEQVIFLFEDYGVILLVACVLKISLSFLCGFDLNVLWDERQFSPALWAFAIVLLDDFVRWF
jgi:hypothetical protein